MSQFKRILLGENKSKPIDLTAGHFDFTTAEYQSEEYDVLVSNGWVIHTRRGSQVQLIRPKLQ